MKPNINVFWFKRDLRLVDNEALINAISEPYPLFLIYLFEPIFIKDVHTSGKDYLEDGIPHQRMIKEIN